MIGYNYMYPIKIVAQPISQAELKQFLGNPFDEMVKLVVDVEKEIVALGGELHSDAEELLLKNDSNQRDLWGANIYPKKVDRERIEYSSLINIRPSQNNGSIEEEDESIRQKIYNIILKLLPA